MHSAEKGHCKSWAFFPKRKIRRLKNRVSEPNQMDVMRNRPKTNETKRPKVEAIKILETPENQRD